MQEADFRVDSLSTRQILHVLDQCLFCVPRPENPPHEGWIAGLAGPACLGAANGSDFRVNVGTAKVVRDARHGFEGTLLDVVKKVWGLSTSEAKHFIKEKAAEVKNRRSDARVTKHEVSRSDYRQ